MTTIEYIHLCPNDECEALAMDEKKKLNCPDCKTPMENAGYMESATKSDGESSLPQDSK